jgi:hypothetical protein
VQEWQQETSGNRISLTFTAIQVSSGNLYTHPDLVILSSRIVKDDNLPLTRLLTSAEDPVLIGEQGSQVGPAGYGPVMSSHMPLTGT